MQTQRLDKNDVKTAASLIKNGGIVAIPTETVYGLGANGLDEEAVKKIFIAKGRPQDNPLILHIPDMKWLSRYCIEIPDSAYVLAKTFWPGPLTMILKRREIVPDTVTAGMDTVGIRCPANDITRKIIETADVPIAAPSANRSGRPSCTTVESVLEDMDGIIEAVVDGGDCAVGVESTIIDLTCAPPRLLRPGGLALEKVRDVLGTVIVDDAVIRPMGAGEKPRAPGMKYRHYAPKAPVTVVKGPAEKSAEYIVHHLREDTGVLCFTEYQDLFAGYAVENLGSKDNVLEQAQKVFDALRNFDHLPVTEIYAQCPSEEGLGLAVCNRLNKAAGFHIVEVE